MAKVPLPRLVKKIRAQGIVTATPLQHGRRSIEQQQQEQGRGVPREEQGRVLSGHCAGTGGAGGVYHPGTYGPSMGWPHIPSFVNNCRQALTIPHP